jgi:hypothetical protein
MEPIPARQPMLRFALAIAVALGSLAPGVPALAGTQATIVDVWPGERASLGHQQDVYVRVAFESVEPVRLWARPYRNGEAVRNAYSNASNWYEGTGEALGWFALSGPGTVDEIRIYAGGGAPYREWELARQPVRLAWSDAPRDRAERPEWVETLIATEAARRDAEMARAASVPVSSSDMAAGIGFMVLVLSIGVLAIGVPVWTMVRWRGGWRVAAAIPVALIGFVILRIVVDTARDPTSHNLWPFEILQAGIVALLLTLLLRLARKWMGAGPHAGTG